MPECLELAAAAKTWIVKAGMMLCVLKGCDWAGVLALGAHSDVGHLNAPHVGFAAGFMVLLGSH